jgi:hypothetical protein
VKLFWPTALHGAAARTRIPHYMHVFSRVSSASIDRGQLDHDFLSIFSWNAATMVEITFSEGFSWVSFHHETRTPFEIGSRTKDLSPEDRLEGLEEVPFSVYSIYSVTRNIKHNRLKTQKPGVQQKRN